MAVAKIVVFLLMALFALYSLAMGLMERYNALTAAKHEDRFDQPGTRLSGALSIVLGQRRLIREPASGIMHIMIFWGLVVFSLGIFVLIMEGLFPGFPTPVLGQNPYFFAILDVFGLLAAIGMLVSAYFRYIAKVPRLGVGQWDDEKLIVMLISGIVLMVVSFFMASAANAVNVGAGRYALAPVTGLLIGAFDGINPASRALVYEIFWWLNVAIALGLLVFFRYSHLVHPLFAPLNIYFRNLGPKGGAIKKLDFEDEESENFGVVHVTDYTWRQLLDCYACAECGRCQDNCPAYLSGKPLSPKKLIAMVKDNLPGPDYKKAAAAGEAPELPVLAGNVISEDIIWACTTCHACQEHCPQLNEHINKIIGLRQYLVLDESEFPAEAQLAFTNLERNSNPWGVGLSSRGDWAEDLGVPLLEDAPDAEYLLYVGCAGSFDERIKNVSTSLVKILKAAGINFAILGAEEKCCGDSARRLGNEYLFQSLVEENLETFNEYGVKKIVTACPHCFNTLKNEYPSFGATFDVVHHTQLINDLIKNNRLSLAVSGPPVKLTYHDSCYLGRYNDEYDAPRQIIGSLNGTSLVEMERNKSRAFCCGAGGGRMWLEEDIGNRINVMRTEQALKTQPEVIAVNCPFCLTMMEDGLKDLSAEENVKTRDIAELVAGYLK